MSRQLLAFKRAPTVEVMIGNLGLEITDDRLHLSIGLSDETCWFSWEEWEDFAARVAHGIKWIEENTPEDVTGSSFEV